MSTIRRDRAFVLCVFGLLVVTAVLRLWQLDLRPGHDWDEPVYTSVGINLAKHGLLQATAEAGRQAEPYLYHPPFYFFVLSSWFEWWGGGIPQARVLAAWGSIILILLVVLFLHRVAGRSIALLAAGALAVDGWMVFSNRVSWIENTMLPLGIAALWLYREAQKRGRTGWFLAAGVALGAVTIYKHVGVCFVGAALLHWLLARRHHRQHLAFLGTFAVVLAAYVAGMTWWFGNVFWRQSGVQFDRSLNLRQSRGALNSITDVVDPLLDQYTIFWVTVLLVAASAGFAIARIIQMVKRKSTVPVHDRELLFAWSGATLVFFAVLQLRLPHYFMMLVVPSYCYLASELVHLVRRCVTASPANQAEPARMRPALRVALIAGCLVVLVWSLAVSWIRIGSRQDNALEETAQWVERYLPDHVVIITEESVGTAIGQPYCKMYRASNCPGAEYLITYESHTQHLPDDVTINRIVATDPKVVEFFGFKEHITVYKIKTTSSGL